MKHIFKNRIFQFALVLAAGLFFGWLLFGGGNNETTLHQMKLQKKQSGPAQCILRSGRTNLVNVHYAEWI
jgi:hypothetical protein